MYLDLRACKLKIYIIDLHHLSFKMTEDCDNVLAENPSAAVSLVVLSEDQIDATAQEDDKTG